MTPTETTSPFPSTFANSKDQTPKWRSLARDIEEAFVSFDSRSYPDGRFQCRVVATDRPSNPPSLAQTDQNISEPFVVDNQPRVIKTLKAKWSSARKIHLEAVVEDVTSAISDADFAVDGSPWLMLPAADGLIDASERLALDFDFDPRSSVRSRRPPKSPERFRSGWWMRPAIQPRDPSCSPVASAR